MRAALVLSLVLSLVLVLSACGARPEGVTAAQAGAEARVMNYAKNQRLLHAAERAAYVDEACAHIETRVNWSLEKIQAQAQTGKLPNGQDVTPAVIIAGVKDVYENRDLARAKAANHVALAAQKQAEAENDLTQAQRLFGAVHAYDETPDVSLEAIPGIIQILSPLADRVKGANDAGK